MSIRIVLDAMGGDNAPHETVKGAVRAARAYGCTVFLVGSRAVLTAELARHKTTGLNLPIIDAPDVIDMRESPAQAVRRKPNSTHIVGLKLVRDGKADAFVSAGHSGATMAGALLVLGRLPGIERPALAGIFPTLHQPVLLLDIGATTDCKPDYLLQFAQMGSTYAERVMGIPNPRVALLANGEEETKGDRLVQEAHLLLHASELNFVGNAEPKDMLLHRSCDVVIADGFVGNMVLKMGEAVASFVVKKVKAENERNLLPRLMVSLLPTALLTLLPGAGRWRTPVGALVGSAGLLGLGLVPLLRARQASDYRSYGGALLLGVKEVTVIAHGKSDAFAIMNAIRQAREAVATRTLPGMIAATSSAPPAVPEPA
jgi:glycerol-3-phosphate acyltransferase PlsX